MGELLFDIKGKINDDFYWTKEFLKEFGIVSFIYYEGLSLKFILFLAKVNFYSKWFGLLLFYSYLCYLYLILTSFLDSL